METASTNKQVGAYRLVQQIGEGGMGSVWLAEHVALGRRAAIKLLHPAYSGDPNVVTRFFNEARAATQIADPGIVQIFDFGHDSDGAAYIAMELLEGEALDHRLHRLGRLSVQEAGRIMRQVASSLGAAHARNIVHRDLKPENIFLVRDPEVPGGERAKVLDFGIAKLIGDSSGTVKTSANAVMGTPVYMSPEQCRGSGGVDARSDVYSLGCVLFTLLAGTPPFGGDAPGELLVAHLTRPAPRVTSLAPHVPASLDALIARCLDKDPAARFQNGAELAAALGAVLTSISGSVLPAHPDAATASAMRVETTTLGGSAAQVVAPVASGARGKRWLLGGGVAAAIGVALAVFALGRTSQPTAAPAADPPAAPAPAPAVPPAPAPSAPPAPSPPPPSAAAPAAPPQPATAAIAFATEPRGAQVFVGADDKPRGVTPLELELDVASLPVNVRLVRRGYATRTVVVDGTLRDFTLVLEKETARVRRRSRAAASPAAPVAPRPRAGDEAHRDDTINPFAD